MANKIGTEGVVAMASESEMILQNISYAYSADEEKLPNNEGNTIGVTKYDEKVTVTMTAKASATPFTGLIGGELTLSNTAPDHLQADVSAGTVVIDDITVAKMNKGYQDLNITLSIYPHLITA